MLESWYHGFTPHLLYLVVLLFINAFIKGREILCKSRKLNSLINCSLSVFCSLSLSCCFQVHHLHAPAVNHCVSLAFTAAQLGLWHNMPRLVTEVWVDERLNALRHCALQLPQAICACVVYHGGAYMSVWHCVHEIKRDSVRERRRQIYRETDIVCVCVCVCQYVCVCFGCVC